MNAAIPNILIVDDSTDSRDAVTAALAGLDAKLVVANSGEHALRLAMSIENLAVIVLDVRMPGIGGFEVAETLRQSPRFSSTPIVFMTGEAMEQHQVFQGYDLGAVDYIFKPIDTHTLRSKVSVFVELARKSEELQRLNETLEERVRARTEELETVNKELQQEIVERQRGDEQRGLLEAQLRQSQKMEAIGTLASGVAHDFNNLLMGVGGCANITRSLLVDGSKEAFFVDEIIRSVESGAAITKQLLAFAHKTKSCRTIFELDSVVEGQHAMLTRLLGEDIELVVKLSKSENRIHTDRAQIEQVLMNLVVNARDAMPEGGTLIIETKLVEQDETSTYHPGLAPGRYVSLRVTDNGSGIPLEIRQRIFDPFFTTKEVGKGTGLGLSTAYAFVEQAGGQIELTSEVGEGSSFEIFLPESQESMVLPATISSPEAIERAIGTVLLVEDEDLVRMSIRYYLEQAGYVVVEARTGTEAVECYRARTGEIDVLLTDTVLPGLSGPRVAAKIREMNPEVRVLLMSAHAADWLREKGRIAPGVRTLHKPFTEVTLLARLREVLAGPTSNTIGGASSNSDGEERTHRQKILVADDEPSVRLALCHSLRTMGYDVIEASDGAEALALGTKHIAELDALVLDAVMPKEMGVAVARELTALRPELPVIFVSGYSKEVALQKELVSKDVRFLQKPIDAFALASMLQAAFDAGARRAEAVVAPSVNGTVLVVEDNDAARLAICDYLADLGWTVLAAASAGAALALARNQTTRPDLLLTDYSLPDMKGDALAREVRVILPKIRIAYMSGYPDLDLTPIGRVLEKPLDLESLSSAIADLVSAN